MSKQNLTILGSVIVVVVIILIAVNSKSDSVTPASTNADTSLVETANPVDVREGVRFPEFSLTEVDGSELTLASISGRPTIVWFTTTWCVPCQIGAKEVAKLDDELGGEAFDVLVVFVDPKEDIRALRQWKEDFANEDWSIAFDNETNLLSKRINLKFLDSKYLLDTSGVVQNADFKIADEKYLNIIRSAVGGV